MAPRWVDWQACSIELLGFFGPSLVNLQDEYAINLSYADRRYVEIARAPGSRSKLLMLDEPNAGMSDAETTEVIGYIQALRRDFGLTIVLIEHKLQVIMGLSDWIAVLDYGKKIAEGLPREISVLPACAWRMQPIEQHDALFADACILMRRGPYGRFQGRIARR